MDKDLKWNSHAKYKIIRKPVKSYIRSEKRRAGVCQDNILKIYLSMVRPMLE